MSKETRDDKNVKKKKKYRYIDTKCHRLITIEIWMIIIYFLKTLIKLL